jgi:hypothetical protein
MRVLRLPQITTPRVFHPTKKSATGEAALNSTKGGRWRRQHAITQAERLRERIMAPQQKKGKSFLCVAALGLKNPAATGIFSFFTER